MMPSANLIDLSHWNVVETLTQCPGAGIDGVIHKCTEGTGKIDDKCAARYYLAKEANLYWGLYHFVRPGSMEDQVDNFLSRAGGADVLDVNTLLALDWEDAGVTIDQALEFLEMLEDKAQRSPVLYSGHVLKDALAGQPASPSLTKYRLWLAQYASKPVLPPGYSDYWAWQFTDKGQVPGISPPTDLNECQNFINWPGSSTVPVPDQKIVTIDITTPDGVSVMVNINGEPVTS